MPNPHPPMARLRELRIEKGFTQAQLAEKADVIKGAISQFEGGHKKPTPAVTSRLEAALGVDVGGLSEPSRGSSRRSGSGRADRAAEVRTMGRPKKSAPASSTGKKVSRAASATPARGKGGEKPPASERPAEKVPEKSPGGLSAGPSAPEYVSLSARVQHLEKIALDLAAKIGDLQIDLTRYEAIAEAVRQLPAQG